MQQNKPQLLHSLVNNTQLYNALKEEVYSRLEKAILDNAIKDEAETNPHRFANYFFKKVWYNIEQDFKELKPDFH